mmetsp:Transcript_13747/g.21391  ORF Transcript_13747/g.21391 Transcript_13747/m.21391 type:complete len:132 (+) Transcript_13747:252-647(+)
MLFECFANGYENSTGNPPGECQLVLDCDVMSVSKASTTGMQPMIITSKNLFCGGESPGSTGQNTECIQVHSCYADGDCRVILQHRASDPNTVRMSNLFEPLPRTIVCTIDNFYPCCDSLIQRNNSMLVSLA